MRRCFTIYPVYSDITNSFTIFYEKNWVCCLQIDPESFLLGFSARSDDLLRLQEPHS